MDYKARFYSPYLNRFIQPDTIIPELSVPQSWNRFSYVTNNPLRFTDPTGHMQASDQYEDSDGKCTSGDKGCNDLVKRIELKKNKEKEQKASDSGENSPHCGQLGKYSPKCPDWHFYTTTHMVCPAEFECTAGEMKDYLSRYAYPGQDHSFPVVDNGIYPIMIVIPNTDYGFRLGDFPGNIRVSVSDGGLMSMNQTLPGHVFHDGIAIRKVYQANNGSWYVTTYSYGNNHQFHTSGVNNAAGPGVFDILDQEMRDNIAAHH